MATVNIKKTDGSYERVADTLGLLVPQDVRYCSMQRSDVIGGGSGFIGSDWTKYPLLWSTDLRLRGEDWTNSDNQMVIPETGLYFIAYSGSYGSSEKSASMRMSTLRVNNTGILYTRNNVSNNGWDGFNGSGFAYLNAGDKLDLWFSNETNAENITIWNATLNLALLQVKTPYIVANKGALVSGGAFQFDVDGNAYTDNYSFDEVRVGTWVNGKPLYKKTIFRNTSTVNLTDGQYSNFMTNVFGEGYIDEVARTEWSGFDGMTALTGSSTYYDEIFQWLMTIGYKKIDDTLFIRKKADAYITNLTVTLWYTKTLES
jgi:hypothetical protein